MKAFNNTLIVLLISFIGGAIYFASKGHIGPEQEAENHWGNEIETKSYILQGSSAQRLNKVVTQVGGDVSREFPIINAVSAMLTPSQAEKIRALGSVTVQDDRTVMTMNNSILNKGQTKKLLKEFVINNDIVEQSNAKSLHEMGIKGRGITVAVIDSSANLGGAIGRFLFRDSASRPRIPVKYDAMRGRKNFRWNDDKNGHGTHVAGIIGSSIIDRKGTHNGIAPDVTILPVKAFDQNGESSYSKVLDALNWVFENRYRYKIRVVNMSLGADAVSHYWQDPINQAVMRLWDAGVVVVVSAGNNGKEMGITVPGNNPYALTVGAASDNDTPLDYTDDRIASFSAKGPTIEGFIKPEVVAYGTGIETKMDERFLVKLLRKSLWGENYSVVSGTSQAAALVSGIAALVLSENPYLSADDVKCRIISSAQLAHDGEMMTYSPFAQGAGMVDAYKAVMSDATGCANNGLDIHQDLLGTQHFAGPARVDDDGEFYIDLGNGKVFVEGTHWGNESMGLQGTHWGNETMGLQASHWGNEAMNLQGTHWGNEVMGLQGTHWGNETMGLQGTHWGNEVMGLLGTHWGNEIMGLQGTHWGNETMDLQSTDLNPEPVDPNIEVVVDESSWVD
ncbi:S8 family peptidase [Glaciecola petra]|uniref:S8 family peptidase n=1 Tax=Glaciecola petra TaxID=3075602 RepID=A0ABU2ZTM8_9ALTE|nr:S8 family peptidase [Aestuariibacter sp. P117]MDT0595616.1 S8 family peptidase [Aestuariibacter sp. P117]